MGGERFVARGDELTEVTGSLAALLGARGEPSEVLDVGPPDLAIDRVLTGRPQRALPAELFEGLLRHLAEVPHVELNGAKVLVSAAPAPPRAVVEDTPEGFRVRVEAPPGLERVVLPGLGLIAGTLRPLGATELTGRRLQNLPSVREVPRAASAELVAEILPALRERMPVVVNAASLPKTTRHLRPRVEVSVTQEGGALSALTTVVYGEPPVARVDGERLVLLSAEAPLRDLEAERAAELEARQELGLIVGRRQHFTGDAALGFVSKLERFGAAGHPVSGGGGLRRAASLTPRLELSSGRFELSFEGQTDAGEQVTASARAVLGAYQAGLPLVPLDDGGFAPLPAHFLSEHGHRVLALLAAKEPSGELRAHARPELLQLLRSLDYPAPPELSALAPLIDGFQGLPEASLPRALSATLRDYQLEGVRWLQFMRRVKLGAVLADDMGLGKTLQALASLPEPGGAPTLVVCPTSVLGNWAREAKRFRPDLRLCVYHGARRELDTQADLVLTSYALLRLDHALLDARGFGTLILDEAQAIKNPESQAAQAAYALRAACRISLSGTPVENRLDELWSQLHFTNPGLLGGRADFDAEFGRPIAEGSAGRAAALRARVAPFVLRRLKRQVAKELPPRTEVTLSVELTSAERASYDAVRAATEREVAERLGASGVFAALEALLRLRQACCHSGLLPGGAREGVSSKLALLVEHLERAHAGGHKCLVFSQWTALLDLVEPALHAASLEFVRLDGSTTDRDAVVQRFQDETGPPVMLISLKAGGTGLNLTAADHVYLLDPWWNPAVEDQAADRAHRIGQERPVIVHRLVAADSVEERILALQEHKRSVAEAALGGADRAAQLTREDLLALLQ